ncbi:LAGLIDADG family homing endonuclease [Candidatus Woesearchaeota archaeon]|nr:LAGLIDADG family homing endonuclease [Candidatus Woesearchaeota archaeon]
MVGNEVANQVAVPDWLFGKESFAIACLRGLFDTDGCVYGKYGSYQQIQFKFSSYPLICSVRRLLELAGFHPTRIQHAVSSGFSSWKVYLSRQAEIERFFDLIRPRNQEHLTRHNLFK